MLRSYRGRRVGYREIAACSLRSGLCSMSFVFCSLLSARSSLFVAPLPIPVPGLPSPLSMSKHLLSVRLYTAQYAALTAPKVIG